MNNSDPNGEDWRKVANVGIAIAAIGLLALATVATGGAAPLLAAGGITAAAATGAASYVVATGIGTIIGACVSAAITRGGDKVSSPNGQSKEYSGKREHLKDGSSIEYEYNGNGTGNVHYNTPKPNSQKIKLWEFDNGEWTFYDIPKFIKNAVASGKGAQILDNFIKTVISLSGF